MKKKSLKKKKRLKIGKKAKRIKIIKKRRKLIKIKKKHRKTKTRKRFKKSAFKRKKISRRSKRVKKVKKKKLPLDRLKAIRLSKIKISKIRIKKRKYFNIKKQLGQLTAKLINAALYPLFRAYDSYLYNRRLKKLKEESDRIKEQEREKKERRRLISEQNEKELRDKLKFAKETTVKMQLYLRQAERQAMKEKAEQHKKILENLKADKLIQKMESRMLREQVQLEKYALTNLKESYEPTLEKIAALKERYKKLQAELLGKKLSELGVEISGDEDKSALLERERQFIFEKSQIEDTLLPYTRSLRSMSFMINKHHLSRNMSPLKVVDLSMEKNKVYLKFLESEEFEDFLMLFYVKNNNLNSGKIVLELKTQLDKHSSHEFSFHEIFRFQDLIIDSTVSMLAKMRDKKEAS